MTVWRRSVAALAGLALAGCGLVTMASQPAPPPQRTVDPATAWPEIKANQSAARTGVLAVDVHVTQPENLVVVVPSAKIRVMPYAPGLWEELSELLRWRYDGGLYYPSKVRDAPRHIDDAITRYNRALAAAGLSDLSRSVDAYLDRPIELNLVAGDYIALAEYQTIGRGPTQKVWVWLERVRVEPQSGLTLVLGDGNTLCAEALTPNGTRCRDK
jgi:hypothetical protein